MSKKKYEPPKMKAIKIEQQGKLMCGSNPYWNDCDAPNEDDWWGSSK